MFKKIIFAFIWYNFKIKGDTRRKNERGKRKDDDLPSLGEGWRAQ